jgi:hypothetical protein
MAKATTLAAVLLDTTLEEAHMEVPETRRLTVTDRSPDMEGRVVGIDGRWKAVGPGAAALPQHEEVCGREALLV